MQIKDWGIVAGNDDGTFAPGRNINRAEFSKMLAIYDERVDEKIAAALEGASGDTTTSSSASDLASIMYITSDKNSPPTCPSSWNDVGVGASPGGGVTNFTRTCYINKSCSVMHLADSRKPEVCPNGWEEASMESYFTGSSKLSYDRICYVCQ